MRTDALDLLDALESFVEDLGELESYEISYSSLRVLSAGATLTGYLKEPAYSDVQRAAQELLRCQLKEAAVRLRDLANKLETAAFNTETEVLPGSVETEVEGLGSGGGSWGA